MEGRVENKAGLETTVQGIARKIDDGFLSGGRSRNA
jgi:hypothetical protein